MKNTNSIVFFNFNTKLDDAVINQLSKLKPAGTQLLLDTKANLIELLKLTLFDLTLKQVLIIKKVLKRAHARDPHLREYVIVETGKNFATYSPSGFENYFTKRIDEDTYFQLKVYIREIYKEITSEYKYKKEIIKDLKLNDYFKNSFFSIIFSIVSTNKKGKKLKLDITEHLLEVDKNIGYLIENKPDDALKLIVFLKGNIFLLKNLKFELLEKLKVTSMSSTENHKELVDDWFWIDFMTDPDLSFSDLLSDISEMFDSIDDYFSIDSGADWDVDVDIDF
ncbi:hypothetical protein GCM10011344_09360 [Dokdonia pacifica]|uniref:Uncharacterized protein n=1 Tax=Dokdonia pacifica TaxID=1627892 RepID=A0A238YQ88_9FLAO|nr:hypothetical protein [Dokdonia pacifica]GGG10777.1 hypothetical protein GCM10011344_09360 [Dokdonia pacifica]SNR73170.1 hypothetical protein SAMN06265376_102262 [Dokdonia pacifica]